MSELVRFEGVCFSAKAVAQIPADEWVAWGMSRYFENRAEEVRTAMLQKVHAMCTEALPAGTAADARDSEPEPPAPIPKRRARRKQAK